MTCEEFSNAFDTLLNSYASKASFGDAASASSIQLDEYEKSVLLTQAQDEVVKSYFDARLTVQGQGFDNSERRQVDFSNLIFEDEIPVTGTAGGFDSRGYQVSLNNLTPKPLFLLNEALEVTFVNNNTTTKKRYVIVPIHYREYDRVMSKAYAQPLKKQAWRIFNNAAATFDMTSEIIPIAGVATGATTVTYKLRYVGRPTPIILIALPDNLQIDGLSAKTECVLNPILHHDILNRAVEIAMTTRGGYADAVTRFRQEQAQQAQRAARQANE